MASLMPSSVTKRLLRYVLLRLDLLDEDDLDLDTIDITWGKVTTLEYRDVRLKTQVRTR
jgi:autophagy-related protein 2